MRALEEREVGKDGAEGGPGHAGLVLDGQRGGAVCPVEGCGDGNGGVAVGFDPLLEIDCGGCVAGQHIGFGDVLAKGCEVEV